MIVGCAADSLLFLVFLALLSQLLSIVSPYMRYLFDGRQSVGASFRQVCITIQGVRQNAYDIQLGSPTTCVDITSIKILQCLIRSMV